MSHTTRVTETRIHDLAMLARAVDKLNAEQGLGLVYREGGSVQLWSTTKSVAATVYVPGTRFNVGFERAPDGNGFSPIFDAHGGEIYRVLGQGREIAKTTDERNLSNIGKLMQAHTIVALQSAALMQGATVSGHQNAAGQYVMLVQ